MIRASALALALMLFVPPAFAQSALTTPGQAVKITADSFVIEESAKQATFTGNVVISRTGLTVSAAKVVVTTAPASTTSRASTRPATSASRPPARTRPASAPCSIPTTQILRLTGNVMVENAAGTMGGAELTVNLANNDTVFKAGEGQRVTGVFTPQ